MGEPSGHQYQGRYLQLAQALWAWRRRRASRSATTSTTGTSIPATSSLADCTGRDELRRGQEEHVRPAGHRDTCPARQGGAAGRRTTSAAGAACTSAACPTPLRTAVCSTAPSSGPPTTRPTCNKWFSTNFNVEVHAFVKNGKYCVVNNTYEPQQHHRLPRRRQLLSS